MKKEENKWADRYRERLKDYSESVPASSWESLEGELDNASAAPRHAYKRMAAAAVILLLLTSSLSLFFLQTPQAEYVRETKKTADLSQPSNYSPGELPDKEKTATAYLQPHNLVKTYQNKKYSGLEEHKEAIAQVNDVMPQAVVEPQEPQPDEKQASPVPGKSSSRRTLPADYAGLPAVRDFNKEKSWSVGVRVGNLPSSANSLDGFGNEASAIRDIDPLSIEELMVGGNPEHVNPEARSAYEQILINSVRREARTDIKHKMPFTVGVSFRFNLSPHFSVETGLNYTLLSSELKAGTSTDYYVKEQRLHYLGIPLKGNWMFFNRKYVSLYLSAGGAFEKSVSGSLKADYVSEDNPVVRDNQKLKVKPLQWSLNSAVGVQYNATRHLGLFVEPGIVYYFDDGSEIETIRKEKPFNFNLQMGLRFTY